LKLASYGQRAASKDLFDIVQVVQSYDQGSETAARLFRAESEINPAYAAAIRVLKDRFAEVTGKAAVHYADFCVGAQSGTIPAEDYQLMRHSTPTRRSPLESCSFHPKIASPHLQRAKQAAVAGRRATLGSPFGSC
jgi:hypothetical protein